MVTAKARRNGGSRGQVRLTPAERRVVALLPTHLTLAAIGERLGCRRTTVKTHVARIYEKLGVRTRAAAVGRAREIGLLTDADSRADRGAGDR